MAASFQELIPLGAVTASGVSSQFRLNTADMLVLAMNVTAVSGTTPRLDAWLQVSPDDGATWYDFPADFTEATAEDSNAGTVTANARNFVNNCTAAGRFLGVYKHVPAALGRIRYLVAGTTPSFTLTADMAAK